MDLLRIYKGVAMYLIKMYYGFTNDLLRICYGFTIDLLMICYDFIKELLRNHLMDQTKKYRFRNMAFNFFKTIRI